MQEFRSPVEFFADCTEKLESLIQASPAKMAFFTVAH
jgi:hypothetical protein